MHTITKVMEHMAAEMLPNESHPERHPLFSLGEMP